MRDGGLSEQAVSDDEDRVERLFWRLAALEREFEVHERVIRAISPAPPPGALPDAPPSERGFPLTEFAMGPGGDLELPETLADIAEVIGRENALRLAEGLPNNARRPWQKFLYVPQAMRPDHPLVGLIGWDAAQALSHSHANMIIEVPVCQAIQRAYRDHIIAYLVEQGLPIDHVAAMMGTTTQLASRKVRAQEETRDGEGDDGGE